MKVTWSCFHSTEVSEHSSKSGRDHNHPCPECCKKPMDERMAKAIRNTFNVIQEGAYDVDPPLKEHEIWEMSTDGYLERDGRDAEAAAAFYKLERKEQKRILKLAKGK